MAELNAPAPAPPRRGRALAWVLLGVVAFLVLLVVAAPAGGVARILEAAGAPARLALPSGRLWSGSAQLYLEGRDLGRLRWDLAPGSLLDGQLGADLVLEAPGHRFRGRAGVGTDGRLQLTGVEGEVREASLDELLRPYAIEPSGTVTFRDGSATVQGQRVLDAHADARWSGGPVSYALGGQLWRQRFPPLDATLRARDGQPVLVVRDPAGEELLDVALDAAGWAQLRVRYRFVALAGFPWPENPAPDTVVVELAEQLY